MLGYSSTGTSSRVPQERRDDQPPVDNIDRLWFKKKKKRKNYNGGYYHEDDYEAYSPSYHSDSYDSKVCI